MNLVDLFCTIEESNIESSRPYLWWGGVSVLAAACGRSVWTRLMGAGGPKLYPNLYTVFVGDSSQGKTLAVRATASRFLDMLLHTNADALPGEGPKFIKWFQLAADKRVQSLRDPGLVVVLEELSSIFSRRADSQLKAFLCAAYDCKDQWTLDVSIQGVAPIRHLCLNMVAAANPGHLSSCFKPEDWNEGLVSRFLFVPGGPLRLDGLTPADPTLPVAYNDQLTTMRDSLRGGLEVGWTEEATAARRTWRKAQLRIAPPHPSAAGYWSRKHPTAAKIAMLLALAEASTTIGTSHWDAALAALAQVELGLPSVLAHTGSNPYSGILAQVLRWMESEAREFREGEILKRLSNGIPPQHLVQTLDSLAFSEQILEVPGAGCAPNRRFVHPSLATAKVYQWPTRAKTSQSQS